MPWIGSGLHGGYFAGILHVTAADGGLDVGHPLQVALFDDSVTPVTAPDQDITYGGAVWPPGAEQADGPGWPACGRPAGATTMPRTADRVSVIPAGPVASVGPVTLPDPHGALIWDPAVTVPAAGMGIAFLYFGGQVPANAGIYTVVWHREGVVVMTCELTPWTVP